MLSKKAISNFKNDWYTYEEIDSINKGLKDKNEWKVIPFEKVIERFYNDKTNNSYV